MYACIYACRYFCMYVRVYTSVFMRNIENVGYKYLFLENAEKTNIKTNIYIYIYPHINI